MIGTRELLPNAPLYIALANTLNCLPSLFNGVIFLAMDRYFMRTLKQRYMQLSNIFNRKSIVPIEKNKEIRPFETKERLKAPRVRYVKRVIKIYDA